MSKTKRVEFSGHAGNRLAGALGLPARAEPKGFVLFAHCFSCGKDSLAAARISRALVAHGYAVLRFDFTGLGDSQGDFGNTGFASNVDDLVAAAAFLREEMAGPSLLVGHSLGGTAVIAAAARIPEVKAVVTIGSPAQPSHVLKNISLRKADDDGSDRALIGGREFAVQPAFVEQFQQAAATESLATMKKALLVLHAPLDEVVGIDEAGKIFQAAKHPKSFIALDGANHLLTRTADAQYVADTITAWVSRYLPQPPKEDDKPVTGGHVRVDELDHKFLRQIATDDHAWLSDEPKSMGGGNLGPDPYEHLLAALGACTSMTIRMYANRKNIPLEEVEVMLSHERRYVDDCDNCEQPQAKLEVISRSISLQGDLNEAQVARLLAIADRCPVHRTIESGPVIETSLVQS